jgi:hypothetical protein
LSRAAAFFPVETLRCSDEHTRVHVAVELGDLLGRCRTGDELAWEALVRQFQGRVYAIAYHYAGNREEARDLAQEIFVRLYQTRGRWAKADMSQSWLIQSRAICVSIICAGGALPAEDIPVDDALWRVRPHA